MGDMAMCSRNSAFWRGGISRNFYRVGQISRNQPRKVSTSQQKALRFNGRKPLLAIFKGVNPVSPDAPLP